MRTRRAVDTLASGARERRVVRVSALSATAQRGLLRLGGQVWPCALGRSGLRARKREGDGATPLGRWCVREVLCRADRMIRPRTALALRTIRPDDGWCDAPADRNYNRKVRHPYSASAERLWRRDGLYDLIVVLGYNDRPRGRGRGSAIFMHVAREGLAPTEGCIALRREHLVRVLERLTPGATISIG
jgi:L,D-peptidoglycan transpeptidase YkuD (ErfK/YbiS/YcfS/YnhG family)